MGDSPATRRGVSDDRPPLGGQPRVPTVRGRSARIIRLRVHEDRSAARRDPRWVRAAEGRERSPPSRTCGGLVMSGDVAAWAGPRCSSAGSNAVTRWGKNFGAGRGVARSASLQRRTRVRRFIFLPRPLEAAFGQAPTGCRPSLLVSQGSELKPGSDCSAGTGASALLTVCRPDVPTDAGGLGVGPDTGPTRSRADATRRLRPSTCFPRTVESSEWTYSDSRPTAVEATIGCAHNQTQ
jgi:hypothetical protein